ncbi:MAG: DUF3078 domain-containing protein [Bacteroidota bacterium]|nr:DUF3078 domain-containing protein [Bacteroidota bacterium]
MKTKSLSTVLLFLLLGYVSFGQVTEVEKKLREVKADTIMGWKKGGVVALNFAQTSLTNWAAGGQNSLSLNGLFSGFATYKQGKSSWDNLLEIGYGLLKQGDEGYRKTDDKIELTSKYGREAFKDFNYAALLNFRTQMSPGYKYPDTQNKISDAFAPAYLMLALGLDYKPSPYISAFIAPVAAKFTFVTDPVLSDAGAFGVTPGETSRSEFGGYLRAIYTRSDFKGEFLKNVAFTTKLDLFSNYRDNPQNIDINWETLIALKVNKFISVSFNINLLYDDNVKVPVDRNGNGIFEPTETPGPRTQFKEILGVGFSYKF